MNTSKPFEAHDSGYNWSIEYAGPKDLDNLDEAHKGLVSSMLLLTGTMLASIQNLETDKSKCALIQSLYVRYVEMGKTLIYMLRTFQSQELKEKPLVGKFTPDKIFGEGVLDESL